jgi:oxygen-independent coproporphyrinogen-3 oxidase
VTKNYAKSVEYLEYLFKEIELQAELYDQNRRVEQLHFGGGTPTFLRLDQMQSLMDKIRQHFNLLDIGEGDYSIEIDPRSVTSETIKGLCEIGFTRFSLGVQDVDEKVQKAVNRVQPLSLNKDVIRACRENNAQSVSLDLIYGLPFQTLESFDKTLDEIIKLSTDRISVFNYAHLPTLFKPQRRIDEQALPSAETKLAILEMSIEKLTSAGYVYIGMDHFAKPEDELAQAQKNGTLHRNFQGYTTHAECDLIGLGVSSISSVAGSYSQNTKQLDDYYKVVSEGHIPVIKGLTLNEDDKIRRSVIQSLACHFALDFSVIEASYTIDVNDYFASELEEFADMEADGLLSISDEEIKVSPKGKFLIRNICRVFDKHSNNEAQEIRFSKTI